MHIPASIVIDGWGLTDRVYKKNVRCACLLGHMSMFITAIDRQGLLFSPFNDQQSWQLDGLLSPQLASRKWWALACLGGKWRWAVGNLCEICVVFQPNAVIIHGNPPNNNAVLFIQGREYLLSYIPYVHWDPKTRFRQSVAYCLITFVRKTRKIKGAVLEWSEVKV